MCESIASSQAGPRRGSRFSGNPGKVACVQSSEQIAVNRIVHDNEVSDAELVQRAQGGTPAAFAELVSRYQDRVYNACYRMCHNEADALDLTQSTFLKALEALGQFQRRSGFYTWLFRIAINLTISHRRGRQRRPEHSLERVCESGHAPAADCDSEPDPGERDETRRRIEWALDQLEDEFRSAVVLKDIEEMDYASIAEVLDVPVGTVKSRIHRGRALLRDLLRKERKPVVRS
jgi:RNA polymerase sigma-70 factor (ECF subfamily)